MITPDYFSPDLDAIAVHEIERSFILPVPPDAPSMGPGMIVIRNLSSQQAERLVEGYEKLIPSPEQLTADNVAKLLKMVKGSSQIRIPLPVFGGPPVLPPASLAGTGLTVRRSDKTRFALLGIGSEIDIGPPGSEKLEEVAVVRSGAETLLIPLETFLKTHTRPNGRDLQAEDLPTYRISEDAPPVRAVSAEWTNFVCEANDKKYEAMIAYIERAGLPLRQARGEFQQQLNELAIGIREEAKNQADPSQDPAKFDARNYIAWHNLIGSSPRAESKRKDFEDVLKPLSVIDLYERIKAGNAKGFAPPPKRVQPDPQVKPPGGNDPGSKPEPQ